MYGYGAPHNFTPGYSAEPYALTYHPGEFQPQSFQPQSFQPQSFQPQSFQPQSFQPQSFQPQSFQPQSYPPQYYPAPVHGNAPDLQGRNPGPRFLHNLRNLLKVHPLHRMYEIGRGVVEGYRDAGIKGAWQAYLAGMWNLQKQNVREAIVSAPLMIQAMQNPHGFILQQAETLIQQYAYN
ncbi:unnamed protein product [Rotaria magnacalcarata]